MAVPESSDRRLHRSLIVTAVILAGMLAAAALVLVNSRLATAAPTGPAPVLAAPGGPTLTTRAVPLPPTLEPLPSHTVQAIMAGLVDPAADGIWNSAGAIVTAAGEEAWAPSTDEDWCRLEGHARALARGAEALSEPARVAGRESWAAQARGLRAASAVAVAAAQRRDVPAIYAASERLLDACQQCHRHYWVPTGSTP